MALRLGSAMAWGLALVACRPHPDPAVDPQDSGERSVPAVAEVAVLPSHARPGDSLHCSWTWLGLGTDLSTVLWTVDGVEVGVGETLDSTGLAVGSTVTCAVTPRDAHGLGAVALGTAYFPGNILIFIADDLGVDKIGAYGLRPDTPPTPTLDSLMDRGVRFTRAWSEPVCSPTRAAIMTGTQPHQTGIGGALGPVNGYPLAEELVTLPELLDAGTGGLYSDGMVGKWHLSSMSLPGNGFREHPNRAGWSSFAGMVHGLDGWIAFDDGGQTYWSWERTVDGVPGRSETYITTANADDAIARMHEMQEPWLLVVSFYAPHAPYHTPPAGLHSGQPLGSTVDEQRYNWMIEAMDAEMGRVLAAMPSTTSANTTVLFTGDNGTPEGVISPPAVDAKGSVYEGGIRVPLVVAGLHVRRPGATCTHLVQLGDLFATVGDLGGVSVDPALDVDSLSFAPCLWDGTAAPARSIAVAERFTPVGFGPYEYQVLSVRDARYKLVRSSEGADELYDLGEDLLEGDDLLASGPLDAEARAAYEALQEAADGVGP